MTLRITTLGRTSVHVDEKEVDWLTTHRRRVALLLFLALERETARDKVLALFWPDSPDANARNSLNQLIHSLRKVLGDDVIVSCGDRLSIGAAVEVDAHAFLTAAEGGHYEEALRIYRGEFVRDVNLCNSVALEHWAEQYRARITRLHRKARRAELDRLEDTDHAAALDLAHAWVDLDPQDDEAHHRYIQLLIECGRRANAIEHYTAYEKILAADDLTPLDETRELIEQLRANAAPAVVAPRAAKVQAPISADADEDTADNEEVILPEVGRLIADLKRRHVLRVTAIYALIAWGSIEVAETAFSMLGGIPAWAPKLVFAAALAGAPIVVACAWYFDITPRGIKRTPSHPKHRV